MKSVISKKKKNRVKTKAWGIYGIKVKDLGNEFFNTKEEARDYLRSSAHDKNPLVTKSVLKKYKVIPIEINYMLPLI